MTAVSSLARAYRIPEEAGISGARRVMAGHEGADPESLEDHLHRLGLPPRPRRHMIDEIRVSGLRGRGGGGFPTGDKLAAVKAQRRTGRIPVVVGNGSESEPASGKDRLLLSYRPHLVLDGLHIAGRLVGADRLILALGRDCPATLVLQEALTQRRARIAGEVEVELVVSPGGFVAGEETALTSWVTGAPPKPRPVPPRPYQRGVGGRPTLVQNVETLAHLALIARFGAEWFRSVGPGDEPGTCLVTLSGAVKQPGIYEIAVGTTMLDLLGEAGWEASSQALLVGGYFGTWVAAGPAAELRFCRAELSRLGASPGSGVILVLGPAQCGLAEGARLVRWLAEESSGQCGPCVMGLPAIAGAMERLAEPATASPGLVNQLRRWCDDVQGRGACHHPDGAVRLARSTLETFAEEVDQHLRGRCTGSAEQAASSPAQGVAAH